MREKIYSITKGETGLFMFLFERGLFLIVQPESDECVRIEIKEEQLDELIDFLLDYKQFKMRGG